MRQRRVAFNSKRQIAVNPADTDLGTIIPLVSYKGSPAHKRNPGDFGLTPPAAPRWGASLCDGVVLAKSDAEKLLREGVCKGLISEQMRGRWPQNVWAVTPAGIPLEAQLENEEAGAYHGYPMPLSDPFRELVLKAWNKKS